MSLSSVPFSVADMQEVYRNEGKYPVRGHAFAFFKVMRDRRPDLFGRTTGVLSEEGANWHDFRLKAQQGDPRVLGTEGLLGPRDLHLKVGQPWIITLILIASTLL